MELLIQGIILIFLVILTIAIFIIYRKINTNRATDELINLNQKLVHENEEIRKTLHDLQEKMQKLDIEFENKIVRNVTSDLTKTKEALISYLSNLKETVHNTASELSSKSDNVSHETKQKLSELEKEINKTIKDISQSVSENTSKIILDIKNTIQKINTEFSENTSNLSERLGRIDQQLKTIEKISSEIQTLQDILKPPKQRGAFGEVLLENLIKDIFPKERYEFQYSLGTEKVDAIIKLDGKILPIDSKFPLDNFFRVSNGDGSIKSLINNIKNMIDDISAKYIKPSEYRTTNFALMYIPSENVWYEVFVMNPDVYKYAVERRVFPVSPNTLMAYLHVISEGLRAFEIERDVETVIMEISSLQNEVLSAVGEYETLEKHLNNALKKINTTKELLLRISGKIESFGTVKKSEV